MSTAHVRPLEQGDFHKNYLGLLENLTVVYPEKIHYETFCAFVNNLNEHHQIYVIEELSTHTIIASGTLLVEPKLIHGAGKVAHIEDIVVDSNHRHQKHGTAIVQHLLTCAQNAGCYKAILDCTDNVAPFYKQCRLDAKGQQMSLYFS